MRKIFIIALICGMLSASCAKNHNEVIVLRTATSTAISKEQALKNLYEELKMLDGATRTGNSSRTVKSIKPLEGAVTRSGNAIADNLLYIVEFEEGEGSAIVAADTRLEPVIAVLDSSALEESDFASDDMEDIDVYMASMISSYAYNAANRNSGSRLITENVVIDTIVHAYKHPMLKTKWHQLSPYNDKCIDNRNGENIEAGCVAIAMGQFVYYHRSPDVINGYYPMWDMLERKEYSNGPLVDIGGGMIGGGTIGGGTIGGGTIGGGTIGGGTIGDGGLLVDPISIEDEIAANFIYNIGCVCNIHYATGDTSANTNEILNAFEELGYNVYDVAYNSTTAKNLILNDKPVYMVGAGPYTDEHGNTGIVGHAWILDGWLERTIRTTTYIYSDGSSGSGGDTVTRTERYCNTVHCNFGWEGKCDGYYNCEVFDLSVIPEYVDGSIGDMHNLLDLQFDRALAIFVY